MSKQEIIDTIYIIIVMLMGGYICVLHGQINGLKKHIDWYRSNDKDRFLYKSKTTTRPTLLTTEEVENQLNRSLDDK